MTRFEIYKASEDYHDKIRPDGTIEQHYWVTVFKKGKKTLVRLTKTECEEFIEELAKALKDE